MTHFFRTLLVLTLFFTVVPQNSAFADETASVEREAAAAAQAESDPFRFGLGWATYGVGGFENTGSSALSMLLQINQNHSLQLLFGVGTVDPNFIFGAGLAYRGRVASQDWAGLHLGVLANVGNWGGASFAIQFGPLLGVQLRPLQNLMVMFDGGPILSVNTAGGGNADADFRVGALVDGMLGFSIHYLL